VTLPVKASELFIERERAWEEAWTGHVTLDNAVRRRKDQPSLFATLDDRRAAERHQRNKWVRWLELHFASLAAGLLPQDPMEMLLGQYKDKVTGLWTRDYSKADAA
jgi:hypothetical protein